MLKINSCCWIIENNEKKSYKIKNVDKTHVYLESGKWVKLFKNKVRWHAYQQPIQKKLITCLKKEQEDFIKQQPWMCVFCNHINTHGTTKCAGVWKGTTPLPHTKFGSLANNQQYFLWGGEKNGECKFPPSVSLFKHKEWKADFQKKNLYNNYKHGVPCNATRCIYHSHINHTDLVNPQIIIYPYPGGLEYYPGETVGHIRPQNETICPRCFNHFPEEIKHLNLINYDKNRVRIENERNWWCIEVLFWIKHEILDKNKLLDSKRCEVLIQKMYKKIITKIETIPEYLDCSFIKSPGFSDYSWYVREQQEIKLHDLLHHFVNYLISKTDGNLSMRKIINNVKTNKLKF